MRACNQADDGPGFLQLQSVRVYACNEADVGPKMRGALNSENTFPEKVHVTPDVCCRTCQSRIQRTLAADLDAHREHL